MATALDIIQRALTLSGALGTGQAALAQDINDAFNDLNDMVAQWQRKRWLVWQLIDVSVVSTGAQSYTIGPGGNINLTYRPARLESAYLRQLLNTSPNQVDYPLALISSRERYSDIALKQLQAFPSYVYYDNAYPLGNIFPWPIPQASIYELHVLVRQVLSSFAAINTALSFPPEYEAALKFNLALRLRVAFQIEAPQRDGLPGLARDALNVIRTDNLQIATLQMPTDLLRPGIYNPYNDRTY